MAASKTVNRRALSLALSLLLLVGVGAVVVLGRDGGGGGASDLRTVSGLVGSEKVAFFEDPAVQEAFAEHGLAVEVHPAGSRQIAEPERLRGYDFAFPSSAPAAETVQRELQADQTYAPFHSPMAIASFRSIVDILAEVGVARQEADGTWTFDVPAFMDLAADDVRWDQIGRGAYPVRKNVLVRTTDPRNSNSAAMYLALTSHVANGGAVVTTPEEQGRVLETVSSLFLEQGYAQSTSVLPFDDYLSQGVGNAPLLFIYEAQFLQRALTDDGSIVTDDPDRSRSMVLMYPSPTVLSSHTVVPANGAGAEVGRLLTDDPTLQELAARHGYRTRQPNTFREAVSSIDQEIGLRTDVVDVIDPPSWDVLNAMILAIEARYESAGTPPPANDDAEAG